MKDISTWPWFIYSSCISRKGMIRWLRSFKSNFNILPIWENLRKSIRINISRQRITLLWAWWSRISLRRLWRSLKTCRGRVRFTMDIDLKASRLSMIFLGIWQPVRLSWIIIKRLSIYWIALKIGSWSVKDRVQAWQSLRRWSSMSMMRWVIVSPRGCLLKMSPCWGNKSLNLKTNTWINP